MACIVQKFGGTSVATLERIKSVANIINQAKSKGHKIVAVVSAMAGVTNKFVGYVHNLNACEGNPEYDSVVSSGELVTSGLLAIALKNLGINARSYASWQVPIFTDNNYGQAVIQDVDPRNLERDLSDGIVPVICGFQGTSPDNRITTLGRGGSDLTAVAVASAIKADLCEIYSDVDGVYSVDPNLYPEAKKIDEINYREMLEMAAQGAKVLQEQSVAYAMKKNVVIRVASSFVDNGGTTISSDAAPKKFCGLAVTHNLAQIRVSYRNENDFPKLISLLEKHFIHTEMFKNGEPCKISIMVDKKKVPSALNLLKSCDFITSAKQEIARRHFSKVSVIGGYVSDAISEELASVLSNNKIEVICCSVFGCRINVIIPSDQLLNAVAVLHTYCGLNK